MKNNFKLRTPVLYLAFNRLDTVKQTFPEIKKAKPKQLFIACDGPRTKEEKKKTDSVRKYILKNINWKCKVKTLFRDKNLGCKYAVSGAIDWFFENVEQGMILEDDVLPNQSFFRFCQEILERYKDNNKIMSISGYNPLGEFNIKESYLFSKYFYCWGWASWRRAWEKTDMEMEEYIKIKQGNKLKEYYPKFIERVLRKKRVNENLKNITNSWAIPFSISHQINHALAIVPRANLVENIGFLNQYSTHTNGNKWDKKFLCHKAIEINFPLKHPKEIFMNKKFEKCRLTHDIKRLILKKLFPM